MCNSYDINGTAIATTRSNSTASPVPPVIISSSLHALPLLGEASTTASESATQIFVPVTVKATKYPSNYSSLTETVKCLIREWPYNFTPEESRQFKRVILGDVDGGQMAPISCSRILDKDTCCIGAFGTICPRIINETNAAHSFLKLFTAGNNKEAADGFLIAIGHQLHAILPVHVPFLVVADDTGYPKSCLAPWSAAGRPVIQFSPNKYTQFRDIAFCEKFLIDQEESKISTTTTPVQGTKRAHSETAEEQCLEHAPKRLKVDTTPIPASPSFLDYLRRFFSRFW